MAAASSGRGEVDTSRAFRSVKEAVAVFGERLLARETQLRPGAQADCRGVRERSLWPNAAAIVATKLDGGGGRPSGLLVRESLSKLNAIANANPDGGSSKPASNLVPLPDAAPTCLVPSSPASNLVPTVLANIGEKRDRKEADLMVMASIKKVEEEAAKTRQEMFQVKKRMADTELAMANLNAKLHRALSKMAHMEAGKAAAARASIQQQRDGDMAALTVWTEQWPPRQPLRHLLSLGEDSDDGKEDHHGQIRAVGAATTTTTRKEDHHGQIRAVGAATTTRRKRKVEKEKPIVPLVVPLINSMLFSKKKRIKDKESLYMKELYSLLRLT